MSQNGQLSSDPASERPSEPLRDVPSDASPPRAPPRHGQRLAARIVLSSLVALAMVLGMIGATLWLSWRFEGAGAAINDAGSLRMLSTRVAVGLLQTPPSEEMVRQQMQTIDATLARLEKGDLRPVVLAEDPIVRRKLAEVGRLWREVGKPQALLALQTGDASAYMAQLPGTVQQIDAFVGMIERDNDRKIVVLRLAQWGLAAFAVLGTMVMIYLLYLWIIEPMRTLREGLQRMTEHDFSTRLYVGRRDEFGHLARGYNQMADELQSLYSGLERRVENKTRQLAEQNRQIRVLYDMAAFLNQPNDIEAMCEGFLCRVVQQVGADGASVRALDAGSAQLSLVASFGLSQALTESEYCMPAGDCHCGQVTQDERALGERVIMIRDLGRNPAVDCRRDGFTSVAVFPIVARDATLGSYSLHFRQAHDLSPAARELLQSLGQLLGVALENRRLDAKARELAVVQERSLVAQGLHDSLAQGLNFLNLQLQLLEDAKQRHDEQEIDEILPLLRTGVEDSYQDVRELLTNFRSRLKQGDLSEAISDTVERFRRQSGCQTTLDIQYDKGAPLAPDQQLQVLFVLQEALSNIRKHAQARHVQIRIDNGRDFTLQVQDDGQGYDPAEVAARSEAHVGLHIMRERAARLNAHIRLESAPGEGARVVLTLPASERQAA
ncbi:HAMP domain-containing protein [Allofranklinella schreckenbergeri]|uniref:Sensor protein n=1 Tax=Allofranklinella schreckenbergeri TaxID=1076744 RepID=A0A3M6R1S2_9BURK|nr:HAMP domain-containing protein [Allofranklinella schreckenbergeri]